MRTVTKQTLDFDRKYTQKRIEDCVSKIKALEEQIEGYNSKLREIEKLENELSEYEKRPIAERTITTYISKTSTTIDIMDRFEEKNEKGFKKYDRMVVKNTYHYDDEYSFNLIIERKGDRVTVGSITMTDFKLGYSRSLIAHAKEEIRKAYRFDLSYESCLSCRQKQKKEIVRLIEKNEHLSWLKNKGKKEIFEILQAYDRIIAIDDQEVASYTDLSKYLRSKQPGDVVTLKIVRNDQEMEFNVTLTGTLETESQQTGNPTQPVQP